MSGEEGVADVSTLRDELAEQRRKYERLSRITDVIRDIDRAAVRATTRGELEQAVVDRITESEPYMFAWIGEQDPVTKVIEPRASGGEDDGYLDAVEIRYDGTGERGDGPAGRAVKTGEIQVSRDIQTDPSFEPWREQALAAGFRTTAAVPIQYDGTPFGVLCVYAGEPDAFDDHEQEILTELAETIALAISAMERRRALIADSVLEVELEFEAPGHSLVDATEELGATLELQGVVSRSADEFVFYHAASGADPQDIVDVVTSHDRVNKGRVVDNSGSKALVEWVVSGPTLATTFGEFGGTMIGLVVSEGRGRVTVELPPGTELRQVVEALETTVGPVTLIAQRTTERESRTDRHFRVEVSDRLTDRQLSALRAAYFSGYHDRPRTSAGEEVAESLGVSPSTFHQHHRVGVRKLLGAAFDNDPSGRSRE